MGKDKQKYKECYSVASVYFDNTSDIHGRTTVFTTLNKALQYMEDIIPAYIETEEFLVEKTTDGYIVRDRLDGKIVRIFKVLESKFAVPMKGTEDDEKDIRKV